MRAPRDPVTLALLLLACLLAPGAAESWFYLEDKSKAVSRDIWEFQIGLKWLRYPDDVQAIIRSAALAGMTTCEFEMGHRDYVLDIANGTQTEKRTGITHRVKQEKRALLEEEKIARHKEFEEGKALAHKLYQQDQIRKHPHKKEPSLEAKLHARAMRRQSAPPDPELSAWVRRAVDRVEFRARPAPLDHPRGRVGFYLHVYSQPKAVLVQMRRVRLLYPKAPVYVMSDGGMNCTGACEDIGNCHFAWRPPANDRWNPKPFFRRFKDAVRWLDTEYVIMLEPDVEVVKPIDPQAAFEFDAGGLADENPPLHDRTMDYLEALARRTTNNSEYVIRWDHFGLAGGTYFRSDAALDAFDSDLIDWQLAKKLEMSHRVYSSDVAMCLVLAARGYSYSPWKDLSQLRFDRELYAKGKSTAFRHYGREEEKLYYGEQLDRADRGLITSGPKNVDNILCQGCVHTDNDEECWPKDWTTNQAHPIGCPHREHGSFIGLDNFVSAY